MRPECCAMRTIVTYMCVQLRSNNLSGKVTVHSSAMKPSSPIISSAVIQKKYLRAARETKRQMK